MPRRKSLRQNKRNQEAKEKTFFLYRHFSLQTHTFDTRKIIDCSQCNLYSVLGEHYLVICFPLASLFLSSCPFLLNCVILCPVSTDVFIACVQELEQRKREREREREQGDILTHNNIQDSIGLKTQVERKRWGGRGRERERENQKRTVIRGWHEWCWFYYSSSVCTIMDITCNVVSIEFEERANRTVLFSPSLSLSLSLCNCILSPVSSLAQEPKSRVVCESSALAITQISFPTPLFSPSLYLSLFLSLSSSSCAHLQQPEGVNRSFARKRSERKSERGRI